MSVIAMLRQLSAVHAFPVPLIDQAEQTIGEAKRNESGRLKLRSSTQTGRVQR